MHRIAAVTAALALTVLAAAPASTAAPRAATAQPTTGCAKLATQQRFERYARRVYARPTLERRARLHMRALIACHGSARARRNSRILRRHLKARRASHAVETGYSGPSGLTPYHCGRHGWFAIPCPIIECESHFDWNAHNPSGADGVYQLLPGVGPDHMAQHRAAAAKWAGGAGASQWVCA